MGQTEGQVTAKGGRLFSDYQNLMRIWTHPWVMKLDEIRQMNKVTREEMFRNFWTFISENNNNDNIFLYSATLHKFLCT